MELIVAIAVITVGLFAVMNLFLSNFTAEQEARNRVVATNLAREGLESVKNIRDSNWLSFYNGAGKNWDDSLTYGSYVLNSNFPETISLVPFDKNDVNDKKDKVYWKNGFYVNGDNTGSSTIYSRVINVRNICCVINNDTNQCDEMRNSVNPSDLIKNSECPTNVSSTKIGLDVVSNVSWTRQGGQSSVTLQEQLFNWK